MGMGVFLYMLQLFVQVELNPVHIVGLLLVFEQQSLDLGGSVGCIISPFRKVRGVVFIA